MVMQYSTDCCFTQRVTAGAEGEEALDLSKSLKVIIVSETVLAWVFGLIAGSALFFSRFPSPEDFRPAWAGYLSAMIFGAIAGALYYSAGHLERTGKFPHSVHAVAPALYAILLLAARLAS